jgi:hypothetical protein
MLSVPVVTWLRCALWLVFGLMIYLAYSRDPSTLAAQPVRP